MYNIQSCWFCPLETWCHLHLLSSELFWYVFLWMTKTWSTEKTFVKYVAIFSKTYFVVFEGSCCYPNSSTKGLSLALVFVLWSTVLLCLQTEAHEVGAVSQNHPASSWPLISCLSLCNHCCCFSFRYNPDPPILWCFNIISSTFSLMVVRLFYEYFQWEVVLFVHD